MSMSRQIRNALKCAMFENRRAPVHSEAYIRTLKLLLIDC